MSFGDRPNNPPKSIRGRPPRPREDVRQILLNSAMNLLLEKGYESVTMELIAKHAAVSKKTVYAHASNRQELIGLAIRQWSDNYAQSMEDEPIISDDLLVSLRKILDKICTQALSDTAVRVFRILTTEFPGKQELMATYRQNGIERGRALLSHWLKKRQKMGVFYPIDPVFLANAILAIAVAEPLRQMAIGETPPITEAGAASHLDACMAVLSRFIIADPPQTLVPTFDEEKRT